MTDTATTQSAGAPAENERVLFGTYLAACRDLFDNSHNTTFDRDIYGDLLGHAERVEDAARGLHAALASLQPGIVMICEAKGIDIEAECRAFTESPMAKARRALAKAEAL